MGEPDAAVTANLLRVAAQAVDAIQQGVERRGFADVRPLHGFAFSWLSRAPATTSGLAVHLGISKQAGAQLVEQLVARGYLRRVPDPDDRRARLLVLTDRGRACTRAADEAAAEVVAHWRSVLPTGQLAELREALSTLAVPGPLRPSR